MDASVAITSGSVPRSLRLSATVFEPFGIAPATSFEGNSLSSIKSIFWRPLVASAWFIADTSSRQWC